MKTWVLTGIALLLSLALAGDAGARLMRVYTCTMPDGQAAGPSIGAPQASGWDIARTGIALVHSSDGCPAGNSFQFEVSHGHLANGTGVWARWTPAPGTSLVGLNLTYGAMSDLFANPDNNPGRGSGMLQLQIGTDRGPIRIVNSPMTSEAGYSGEPPLSQAVAPSSYFSIGFACPADCTLGTDGGFAQVLRAQFDVDDPSPPTGGLLGSAVDAQVWSGAMRLTLNAVDQGSGVYRALVVVDGADALSAALAGGACRDVGPDPAVNEFVVPRPCPLRIDSGAVDVDSAVLPQGRHEVRVALEDAAGNRTWIFGPVMRTIAANGPIGPGSDLSLRGPANGEEASDQARLTAHWGRRTQRSRLMSGYGRRHVVYGRLVGPDGTPITKATLDVVSKTTAVNARELAKRNGPVTDADGRWSLVLPRTVSSRDVTFRYRSHVGDTVPTATAGVQLRVRAGLRMRIRPRVARRGQTILFSGRLLGGPLPPGGKQIVLVARGSKGPWLRFNVVRTGAGGRFRATYRFAQPGTVRYRFRALSRAEAAYPYLAGGSNVVRVLKR